ncbi:unnamed protein product [Didymodactylos carnosus]|uniref:Uncharacterized protein n=1 Tax=Didymodactylos carnosus TaxID=1234261 RepID=A0A814CVY2_9BILA|nr:unnamed protein product [Didymodactylos carnosus]CAF1166885.1 unnamed protein product [Didymodactylos carnosus]CAF3721582.1 unnamed protein product [Didymodactylos carnosus]CAF3978394.1 unnamed protein product [Didymodactylos carnosus]
MSDVAAHLHFLPKLTTNCSDPFNVVCEKFLQIWAHKAANIANDLIEYAIRRMQCDRLKHLFDIRNEYTQRENITAICRIGFHNGDDLPRMKEQLRSFCLATRNVVRHLRADGRLRPNRCIDLDQGIISKMCRFIYKSKVLLQILQTGKHLPEKQREQIADNVKKKKTGMTIETIVDVDDPYRDVTKAFIALQSDFELLFGDVMGREFFQTARTGMHEYTIFKPIFYAFDELNSAVQTIPIILDINRVARTIYCILYKIQEPERLLEEATRAKQASQSCKYSYGPGKRKISTQFVTYLELFSRSTTATPTTINDTTEHILTKREAPASSVTATKTEDTKKNAEKKKRKTISKTRKDSTKGSKRTAYEQANTNRTPEESTLSKEEKKKKLKLSSGISTNTIKNMRKSNGESVEQVMMTYTEMDPEKELYWMTWIKNASAALNRISTTSHPDNSIDLKRENNQSNLNEAQLSLKRQQRNSSKQQQHEVTPTTKPLIPVVPSVVIKTQNSVNTITSALLTEVQSASDVTLLSSQSIELISFITPITTTPTAMNSLTTIGTPNFSERASDAISVLLPHDH